MQLQRSQQKLLSHSNLHGRWQREKEDLPARRVMIGKIVRLLRQRKPDAPEEWFKKLPRMAQRLEAMLYKSAPSFSEYNETATLPRRLKQLAANIHTKMRQARVIHNDIYNV